MGKVCFRASLRARASLLVFAMSMLIAVVTICPASAQTTTVGVEPDNLIDLALQAGSTFKVGVWVRNVADLVGVDFKLGYNTTILTATEIEYGGIFGENYFPWIMTINDAEGRLQYGITTMFGEPSFTGDGRVANITFTVDSYGSSLLNLYETKLTDSQTPPNPIEHIVLDGYFNNKILGDVDGDGTVGSSDLLDLSEAYGSTAGPPPSPNWNHNCDVYWDGKVDVSDLFNLGENYGESMP